MLFRFHVLLVGGLGGKVFLANIALEHGCLFGTTAFNDICLLLEELFLGDGGKVDEVSLDVVSVEFRLIMFLQGIIGW